MKNVVVTASEIGKTTYCPHSHYLSTKHAPNKAARKRMAHGNKMHSAVGHKSERLDSKSKLNILINLLLLIIILGLANALYQHIH